MNRVINLEKTELFKKLKRSTNICACIFSYVVLDFTGVVDMNTRWHSSAYQ